MQGIYLDHAATTPLRPQVSAEMESFQSRAPGNPSSIHRWGRTAHAALEDSRARTASLLTVRPDEVRFVRGGTESCNLAILGRADRHRRRGGEEPFLVRSALEHSSVRACMEGLASGGARVEVIPVHRNGTLTGPLRERFRESAVTLFSCQWVNQEIGLVLPIEDIAEECKHVGVPLHVDGVQAAGRVPIDLERVPIDLLSLSGHKLGGPVGTGVLVVRSGVELEPRLFGGGQEGGLRPGTEDVAGALGFTCALELAMGSLDSESQRLTGLRDSLELGLRDALPDLRVHGEGAPRAPHILGVGIPGLPHDILPGALDLEGIGVSAGSACRSGSTEPSPVLEALYGDEARDFAPLRLSLGWTTTRAEVEMAVDRIPAVVKRVRERIGQ